MRITINSGEYLLIESEKDIVTYGCNILGELIEITRDKKKRADNNC